jgi:hypothetical protein
LDSATANTRPVTVRVPHCCGMSMRQITSAMGAYYCTNCRRIEVESSGDEAVDEELLKKITRDCRRFFGDG